MDDGGKLDYTKNEGKGIVFNTQSFTQEEVNNMCKELKEKFNLHTWVGKNKNRHIIKISGQDYEKMMDGSLYNSSNSIVYQHQENNMSTLLHWVVGCAILPGRYPLCRKLGF